MDENSPHKRPVVFISQDDLTFNGRFIKFRDALEMRNIKTGAVSLSKPVRAPGKNMRVIARPDLKGGPLASSVSYRIQKRRAVREIGLFAPRVLHAMDYIALDVAAAVKKIRSVKIIFDACEIFSETATASPAVAAYVDKIFNKHSSKLDAVITPSTYLQNYYANKYSDWPTPTLVTNAPARVFAGQYDGRLHKATGLSLSDKILLYHGGFSPKRGLETLIDTAADLPDDHYLVLMGWGVLQAALEMKAKAVNAKANRDVVRFAPPVPQADLFFWISGAEYGLIPYEGGPLNHDLCTPNKLYEYPAAGVPLIVANRPSLVKVIDETGVGAVLPSPLTGEKINTLSKSLKPQDRQPMVEASERFAKTEVGQSGLDELLDLYGGLLRGATANNETAPYAISIHEQAASPLEAGLDLYGQGDYKSAHPLLEQAANKGESEASFLLGVMFQLGAGVAVDYEEARRCYELAANKQHANAALNLGVLHHAGLLGEDNLQNALYWYQRAEALGASLAAEKKLEVLDIIDPEQAGLTRVALARARPRKLWDRLIARR